MKKEKLFNFDVGKVGNVNLCQYQQMRFGRLSVLFRDDYDDKIADLKQMHSRQLQGFVHTADLLIDENACKSRESVLLYEQLDDGGISDFLELATFFTGKRVVIGENMERYLIDTQIRNNGCCSPMESLYAAWGDRQKLVDAGIVMAMFLLNSVRSNMLQTRIFHYASAMDIISKQMSKGTRVKKADICKDDKAKLMDKISTLLNGCDVLFPNDDVKETYRRSLASLIYNGPSTTKEKIFQALINLGVLDGEPSESTKKSIDIVDMIRNRIIHSGNLPTLDAGSEYDRLFGKHLPSISVEIIPRICILGICQALNVPEENYQLYKDQVKKFFLSCRL